MDKLCVGILASGDGDSAAVIMNAVKNGELDIQIGLLISNSPNARVLEIAKSHGITTQVIKPDMYGSREDYDTKLASEFWNSKASLILVSDYTRVMSMSMVNSFKDRIIAVHPSILPAFCGKGMYGKQVIKSTLKRGVTMTGYTAYLVDENIAEGKILDQKSVEISPNDTIDKVQKKIYDVLEEFFGSTLGKYARQVGALDFQTKPYALRSVPDAVITDSSSGTSTFAASTAPSSDYFDDRQKQYTYNQDGMQVFALCDVGLKRKENMDTVLLTEDGALFGAADGVGSAKGGKQTSRMIMNLLQKRWQEEGSKLNLESVEHGAWLRKAVIESNQQIVKWAATQSGADLGSTLVIALLDKINQELYISNTGDSRAYLWRSNMLYRLTRDHSEDYDPETGEGGALLYYIGGGKGAFALDIYQLKLYPGDKMVLCSDGLLYATEQKIIQRFQESPPIDKQAFVYLEDTYEAGAPDNTSIVLLHYGC